MEHDERAAAAPGLRPPQRPSSARASPRPRSALIDPHRVQLAVPTPDDARDAGDDPAVVVADEDPELLRRHRGRRRRSPQPATCSSSSARSAGGRRVLDDEAIGAVHPAEPARRALLLRQSSCAISARVVEVASGTPRSCRRRSPPTNDSRPSTTSRPFGSITMSSSTTNGPENIAAEDDTRRTPCSRRRRRRRTATDTSERLSSRDCDDL